MAVVQRPLLPTRDTLDTPRLSGTLRADGMAALNANGSASANGSAVGPADDATKDPPATAAKAVAYAADDDTASDDSLENYDDLELDPDTLVTNSRRSLDAAYRPSGRASIADGMADDVLARPQSSSGPRRGHAKRSSIQIKLEKTERRGRYILTADDPEIKEILRKGIEREEVEAGSRKPRMRIRDLVFTRQFTTFDRQNPLAAESPFFGFFTLFWLAMLLLFFQVSMHNLRDYGSILGQNQIMKLMFSHDVLVLALTDGVMCASAAFTLVLQIFVQRGAVNWNKGGWIIQNLWQSAYLAAVVGWAYFREWPWTHTIFAVLHGLVFVMKQHSFAFYNGYLSGVSRRKAALERKLKQLEQIEPITTPTSPRGSFANVDFSTGVDINEAGHSTGPTKRRPSMGPRTSTNFTAEKSDVAGVASAIESGRSIDTDQMETFSNIITAEIADLARELQGRLPEGKNSYPNNLSVTNFFEFICLPTLVYELNYPRQERINWWYVLEKTTATFGVLCVMMVVSQAFIYPPVAKTVAMKEAGMSIDARWREFPFIVSDMLFPLLIEQLLTWYLIWECILNVLAELTRFADRGFYGDWWNSVTFDQYARDWNRPVHNFLLRHVYHSSISSFHFSRPAATFVTFLLSALVHEMCMAIMFKKVRGYLFWSQLLQIPLVSFSRSKLMKGRVVLGNTMFWIGLFIGPSFLTALYLVI